MVVPSGCYYSIELTRLEFSNNIGGQQLFDLLLLDSTSKVLYSTTYSAIGPIATIILYTVCITHSSNTTVLYE